MKTLVIYHANCPDGFAAAWAAWTVLQDTATYLPFNYGEQAPSGDGYDSIYLVDFSVDRDELIGYRDRGKKVVVIDHHKTAEEKLRGLDFCIFDMNHCGAVLTWKYFHPLEPIPRLLRYIEDRDLWEWKLPNSREINAALRLYPRTFESLKELAKDDSVIDSLLAEGRAVLKFQTEIVNGLASKPVWRTIGGYRVPTVNASVFFSEVTEALCQRHPDAPFSACWFERQDGRRQWRFTSRGNFDVSNIAQQFRGGGHAAAAGCDTAGDITE